MNNKNKNNDHIDGLLKEQLYDEKFASKIKNLERKQPPENLWLKIEQEIGNKNIEPEPGFFHKLSATFRLDTGFGKIVLSGSTLLFLSIVGYYLLFLSSNPSNIMEVKNPDITRTNSIPILKIDSIENKNPEKSHIIQKNKINPTANLTESEFDTVKYQKKINKLLTSAEVKKVDMDPYIKSIYDSRLASIDESIIECKTNLADNGMNTVVRKSLILAYGEKVKVLLDIIKN